jgi:methyl-accepting chemotaxis protein
LIHEITETIDLVDQTTATIAAAVEEQAAATLEISRSVGQAAQGTQEVSGGIFGVSETAQQAGIAAAGVLSAANDLSRDGEALKSQVDAFLQEVRAA